MDSLELSGCVVDLRGRKVRAGGEATALTEREVELLRYLARRPGQVISREELLVEVWGYSAAVVSRAADTAVRRLRGKIEVDPAEPAHIFTVHGVGYRYEGPALRDPAPAPGAPAPREPFFGREAALTRLGSLLEERRLVTITGHGGLGKTRLAQQFATGRAAEGWFCDLAEATTLLGLVEAVAVALEVPLSERGPEEAAELVGLALAGRGPALLILDNFEQLVEHGPATAGRWLEQAGELRLLVTSRERLRLAGEVVLELPPLSPEHATALFRERALAAEPGLDEAALADCGAVVERLEGIPLAIEFAAARVGVLPPAVLLAKLSERIDARFSLLRSQRRGASSRQATLRGTLDWSWALLDQREQRALARCAVFRGGFDLEALAAALGVAFEDAADAAQALRDKSLLRASHAGGEVRFSLFETVRAYAEEKLLADPEAAQDAAARHGRWYARFGAPEAIAALSIAGGATRLRRLAQERYNLLAAAERGSEDGAPDRAVPAALAAVEVLLRSGPFPVAIALLDRVLCTEGLSVAQRSRLQRSRGQLLSLSGRTEAAEAALRDALAAARAIGDGSLEGAARGQLGQLSVYRRQLDEAREHYEAALALATDAGDRVEVGRALGCLANIDAASSRRASAEARYGEALVVARAVGDRLSEVKIAVNLGCLHVDAGELARAGALFSEALEGSRDLDDRRLTAVVLGNLANVWNARGRRASARRCFEEALPLHRAVGNRRGEGIALRDLAEVESELGERLAARGHLEEALAVQRSLEDPVATGMTLVALGKLTRTEGDLEGGAALVEEALGLYRAGGFRRGACHALGTLAGFARDRGELERAADLAGQALAEARDIGDRLEEALLCCLLGHVHADAGRPAAARAALSEAEALATSLGLGEGSTLGCAVTALSAALQQSTEP